MMCESRPGCRWIAVAAALVLAGSSLASSPAGARTPMGPGTPGSASSGADVWVELTMGSGPLEVGDELDIRVTTGNVGPAPATGMYLTISWASRLAQFVSIEAGDVHCTPQPASAWCQLGDLEPGADHEIVITVVTVRPGTLESSAEAASWRDDPDWQNNSAEASRAVTGVGPLADVWVAVTANSEQVAVGDEVQFTVTAGNNGPQVAPGASLTDTWFDGRAELVSVAKGDIEYCDTMPGGTWCWLGELAPDETVQVVVTARTLTTGTLTNEAEASSWEDDPDPDNNRAGVIVEVIPVVPAAVAKASAAPGDTRVRVSWTPPGDDGGAPVTRYRVRTSDGRSCTKGPAGRVCTVTGLTNGTRYRFTVQARNDIGWGQGTVVRATPRTVPGKPTAVAGTARDKAVKVAWKAPASNGGAPITAYRATASPGGRTCTTTGARTCVVTKLTNGKAYTFTVRAKNAAGWGAASKPSAKVIPRR
jgi:hypothetical protein